MYPLNGPLVVTACPANPLTRKFIATGPRINLLV